MSAYQYVCEHVIPGCTTRIEGSTKQEVRERAARHLEEHHGFDFAVARVNDEMWQAIVRLRS